MGLHCCRVIVWLFLGRRTADAGLTLASGGGGGGGGGGFHAATPCGIGQQNLPLLRLVVLVVMPVRSGIAKGQDKDKDNAVATMEAWLQLQLSP